MKIVAISDTHNKHESLTIPDGDVLVHCGDFSTGGSLTELMKFNMWLGTLPHKHKIVVPGNHDFICEDLPELCRQEFTNAILLIDQMLLIEDKKFYGTPWVPEYGRFAFMLSEAELALKFSRIPNNLDVLITHGPPKKVLDKVRSGEYAGSESLYKRCLEVRPKVNVFGHIHEGYGKMEFMPYSQIKWGGQGITFLNVSNCDVRYKPVNPVVTFEI